MKLVTFWPKWGSGPMYLVLAWWLTALASAFWVYGPAHADEWYQITAFYLYRLGLHQVSELPWEFAAQIRPWFQPALYASLLGPFIYGMGYHHLWAERCLHLIQALFLVPALLAWIRLRPSSVDQSNVYKWGALALASAWFAPSMLVRHSSEALSTVFVVFAMERSHRAARTSSLAAASVAGFVSGLAFWARFQSALFTLPLLALSLKTRPLFAALVGGFTSLLLGGVIDAWGYEQWVCSPFNYLWKNIVEDKASDFGRDPWIFYVGVAIAFTINPFIWLWIGRGIQDTWRRKDRWLSAASVGFVCFLIVHSAIAHKEPRFLIPIWPAGFLLALYGLASTPRPYWVFSPTLSKVILGLNLVVLIAYSSLDLVRPRRAFDSILWAERPLYLVTQQGYFGTFDESFGDYKPGKMGFGASFVVPPGTHIVGAYQEDYPEVCLRYPNAMLLFTDHDRTRNGEPAVIPDRPSVYQLGSNPYLPLPVKKWRFGYEKCEEISK